jgi:hypothetical protein
MDSPTVGAAVSFSKTLQNISKFVHTQILNHEVKFRRNKKLSSAMVHNKTKGRSEKRQAN